MAKYAAKVYPDLWYARHLLTREKLEQLVNCPCYGLRQGSLGWFGYDE